MRGAWDFFAFLALMEPDRRFWQEIFVQVACIHAPTLDPFSGAWKPDHIEKKCNAILHGTAVVYAVL